MSALATVQTLTSYKAWANEALFATLRAALPELDRSGDVGLARLVLDHALVVDLIFQAHLNGVPHGFTATRSDAPPALSELAERCHEVDRWYVDYASSVSEVTLSRRSDIRFTDGNNLSMSPLEMILHVVNHGTYHRGNVGVLLQRNGIVPA